jgi:uncharacterized membrane protein
MAVKLTSRRTHESPNFRKNIKIHGEGNMLLLAKLAALGIVIWFYMTADKVGEPPVKWVVIGLIGYLIVYLLVNLTVVTALIAMVAKKSTAIIVFSQIPAICGLAAAYFIRKKLLSNANAAK